ncbi:MAG: alpha-galactosidase [Clostridia bacterium]|nr:alpha-galactosidase [Clostridia bacterium]
MIYTCDQEQILTFSVLPPLYLPFYNQWGANAYYTYSAFDYDPFTLRASSTSGSPVVLAGEKFFGFLTDIGGRISYDGCGKLTFTCPAGQSLWVAEECNPYEQWRQYNDAVLKGQPEYCPESFWSGLEYCTWVDQKNVAVRNGSTNMQEFLCESYVYDYMIRVEKLGLSKGKLTIDDGWDLRYPTGEKVWGNWEIDRNKFPHMEQLVRDMTSAGFVPGLWFAPFTFTPNCILAQHHPELIGENWNQRAENYDSQSLMFIKPSPILERYYDEVFGYYIDMGFRKFKLDMSYGNKREMKELLAMMYRIIKKHNPTVEVEAHIPDIFVSRYCDTVRINDVSFDDKDQWRAVTMEHYKVCRYSSHDRILNLDHIGTNTSDPEAAPYLAHARLLLGLEGGFPCVSLLPDRFDDPEVVEEYVVLVNGWCERQKKR